jgi:Trk-type K+ transport system membrane component
MRSSNVYEERSLGIYAEDEDERRKTRTLSRGFGFMRTLTDHLVPELSDGKQSNGQFVRQQIRAQLAHDAWTIVLALFFIMIVEGSQFSEDPAVYSVFNFLFEIVSAYGCVGISVGIPTANYSFSGSWHVLSKLILCVVMLRGRHRGLPVAIDLAVLLPGDRTAEAEEDDGRIRRARSASRGTRSEVA